MSKEPFKVDVTGEKPTGSVLGEIIGVVLSAVIVAIIVALAVKFIIWLF